MTIEWSGQQDSQDGSLAAVVDSNRALLESNRALAKVIDERLASASRVTKAAVIVFDNQISGTLLSSYSDSNNIFVEFMINDRRLVVGSCYSEPDGDLTSLDARVSRLIGESLILSGDLNARNIW